MDDRTRLVLQEQLAQLEQQFGERLQADLTDLAALALPDGSPQAWPRRVCSAPEGREGLLPGRLLPRGGLPCGEVHTGCRLRLQTTGFDDGHVDAAGQVDKLRALRCVARVGKGVPAGKKSVAERIVYGAFDSITKKGGKDPLEVFNQALANAKPPSTS